MDCAYRKVRVRRWELEISTYERCAAAKLAKIGFRRIKNILETPAGPVLLVLTLRERRNSEKTRTKKRKKQRKFSVHDVPALREETHLCCKQGQSRECPSGSKRVLHRLQLRSTNYPAVGKQTDGIGAPRAPHPRSTYPTHSATTQRGENCCAVLLACSRLQTLKSPLPLRKSVQKKYPGR